VLVFVEVGRCVPTRGSDPCCLKTTTWSGITSLYSEIWRWLARRDATTAIVGSRWDIKTENARVSPTV
jgi:hypothetical protein